jgi:hypothetical protein
MVQTLPESPSLNCLPTSTNPSNAELLEAIGCFQEALNKAGSPTDMKAVHFGTEIALCFADQSWCVARGDPSYDGVYALQCAHGAPGERTKVEMTVDRPRARARPP